MIPGTRLAAVFGRVVRAESFTLIIAPAIADLQFERPAASPMQQIRNYIGVWRAFCGALLLDLSWNARVWLMRDVRLIRLDSQLSAIWPGLLLASYTACSLVFIADISTGAAKLSRSALIHNAALRSVVNAAMVLLLVSALFFILECLSKIRARRRERRTPATHLLLEE